MIIKGDPIYVNRQVTVRCAVCGQEHTGEYLVLENDCADERRSVARRKLAAEGWGFDPTGNGADYCPDHSKG